MEITATGRLLVTFALVFLVLNGSSAGSLPDSGGYDQCVLESMKGITSRRAADNALRSCREKLEETELDDVELPPGALGKLIIHAGFGYGIFSGSIYNGNNDYTVTQITVLLAPTGKKKFSEASMNGQEYNIDLTVQPFTTSAISMPIPSDSTQEYLWKLMKASGYKTR